MRPLTDFADIAVRMGLEVPTKLASHLSKLHTVADLRSFLDDVAAAQASATILDGTELHGAALRRVERLGFGPADFEQSKKIMLGIVFSAEVLKGIEQSIGFSDVASHRRAA
ncbi:MAG: hypothetical protein ACYC96_06755 [Fimbriimonadaceae bacterium]